MCRGHAFCHALLLSLLHLACAGDPPSVNGSEAPEAIAPSTFLDDAAILEAQRHIFDREYHASHNDRGLQAPNRRHNLRTYFSASGIRVYDRTEPGSSPLLGLTVSGLGRGSALANVVPGELTRDRNRVEIRRPNMVEWYVNSGAGLEQGFTVLERPVDLGPLTLELALEYASAALDGDKAQINTSGGRRLVYGPITVVDALGTAVAARIQVPEPQTLLLTVADSSARYPLTVDPLLTGVTDMQLLGWSVSGAGDVNGDGFDDVIVGASGYDAGEVGEGAAFVVLPEPSGLVSLILGVTLLRRLSRWRVGAQIF